MTTLVNGPAATTARLAQGLSVRALALETGIEQSQIKSLEEGTYPQSLTLANFTKLADHLAIPVHRLLITEQPEDIDPAASPSDDAARLGALLLKLSGLTSVADIAAALDWKVDQFNQAARELEQHLAPIGLQLHRLKGRISLRAQADVDAPFADLQRLGQTSIRHSLLTPARAKLLYLALRDGSTPAPQTHGGRSDAGALVNAGWLTATPESVTPSVVLAQAALRNTVWRS